MYFIYGIFTNLIIIFIPIIFFFRVLVGKEDLKSFKEKLCIYTHKINSSKSLWFHAASVGELMSIIPIIKKFEKNKKVKKIILTTTTRSSAKIFTKFKFKKTTHIYYPLDSNHITKKFINFWQPKVAIFVESEIWPNMFKNLEEKKIPIIIINARITKKTFSRWKIFKTFSMDVFNKVTLALPQNSETKKYLKALGSKKIIAVGNLKYFGEKKIFNKEKSKLRKKFKKFKVWCAASTHDTEEILVAKLHKDIKKYQKKLITIIIPRHINRCEKIIKDLKDMNLNVVRHSSQKKLHNNTDIYIVDAFGESSNFYNLTSITFMGGSIVKHGGQNPLEAARLGNHIINGPNIDNFKEIYFYLKKYNISFTTSNVSKMKKIILRKINKKMPINYTQKIYLDGNKILNRNISYINKYLR